jgi:hypothetical protein
VIWLNLLLVIMQRRVEGSRGLTMKDVVIIDQAVPRVVQDLLESIALGDKLNWFRSERATYAEGTPLIFPLTADSIMCSSSRI